MTVYKTSEQLNVRTADITRRSSTSFTFPNKRMHLTQGVAVSYWGLYATLVLVAQNIFQMFKSINVTRRGLHESGAASLIALHVS